MSVSYTHLDVYKRQHLCQNFALPRISDIGPQPSQIVSSLSDRPVPFGEAAPDATQFFEAYTCLLYTSRCV